MRTTRRPAVLILALTAGPLLWPPALAQQELPEAPGFVPLDAVSEGWGPAALLSEGATLSGQRGEIHRLGENGWAFVFAPNTTGPTLPPMPLLPCTTLQAMAEVATANSDDTTAPIFILSAHVLVYRGKNYAMPTAFYTQQPSPLENGTETEESRVTQPIAAPHLKDAENPNTAEPLSADDLLKDLDDSMAAINANSSAADEQGKAQPEGGTIQLRDCIAERIGPGHVRFTLRSAGKKGQSAPMTVLPCLNLERIEDLLAEHVEDEAVFTVSGSIHLQENKNYLLPSVFFLTRGGGADIEPAKAAVNE